MNIQIMRQPRRSGILMFLAVLVFAVSGCTGLRPGEMRVRDIELSTFGFIKEGRTHYDEVVSHFGPPTYKGANGSVCAYRMRIFANAHHTSESFGWTENRALQAAVPELQVQKSLEDSLYGNLPIYQDYVSSPAYEVVFIFDKNSILRQYRLFKPFIRLRQD